MQQYILAQLVHKFSGRAKMALVGLIMLLKQYRLAVQMLLVCLILASSGVVAFGGGYDRAV